MDYNPHKRNDLLHLFAGAFVLVLVFVSIVGNLILQLKYKVQMSWKTEVNYGLSLPVILKEIPPSSQIFVGMYGTQSGDDLSHRSKWK